MMGRLPNQTTCQNNSKTKPTRIDAILANPEALTLIYDFEVEKVDGFPTHSFLRIKLSRNAIQQERLFARNMPSLKQMFENRSESVPQDRDGKTKAVITKEEKKKLHEAIDKRFREARSELRSHERKNDTTSFWRTWSKTVESGWIDYLGMTKDLAKKNRGRGEVKLVRKTPAKKNEK